MTGRMLLKRLTVMNDECRIKDDEWKKAGARRRDIRHSESFPLLALASLVVLAGCKTFPAIPLTTPKPLEVNLNMRLDVYQYRGDEPQNTEVVKTIDEATQRQRNRMEEIQTIKNNRFIGEDHRGLLQLREVPAGDWGAYVKRTIDAENEDRTLLMRNQAKETNKSLNEIQNEQWKLRVEKAFKGEWIEVPGASSGSYKWVKADGPTDKANDPTDIAPLPVVEKKDAKPTSPPKP